MDAWEAEHYPQPHPHATQPRETHGLHGAHCPYSAQAQAVLAAHGGRCTGCAVCAHRPRNRPPRALRAGGAGRRGRGYKGVVEPRGGRGARAESPKTVIRGQAQAKKAATRRIIDACHLATKLLDRMLAQLGCLAIRVPKTRPNGEPGTGGGEAE